MATKIAAVGGRFELESHPRAVCPPVRVDAVVPENSAGNVNAAYRDRFHECPSPAIRAASSKSTQFDGACGGASADVRSRLGTHS